MFSNDAERVVARATLEAIRELESDKTLVPTSAALSKPEVQKRLVEKVEEKLKPVQGDVLGKADPNVQPIDIAAVVAATSQVVVDGTIDIPRIAVVPTGEVTTGFHPFTLDVSQLNLQPGQREIVIHNLHTDEQDTLAVEVGLTEKRPEDYIVHALIGFDDIDYFTQAELLYDLAGQMVKHLQSYLSESEVIAVLDVNRQLIAKEIHAQMMAHFWEKAAGYDVQVSRGFTELRPCSYTTSAGQPPKHFKDTDFDLGKIKQYLFGGFQKCLYPFQKFDSDSERRFSVILERDAIKWFKPAKGQFQMYYKLGIEQPEYVPDFVVETDNAILMVETKKKDDIPTAEVQAKADAAVRWCKHASDHAATVNGKPWKYLLVPHDAITEDKSLSDYLRFERRGST